MVHGSTPGTRRPGSPTVLRSTLSIDMLHRRIAVILPIVLVLAGMVAVLSYRTAAPAYSVTQVRRGLLSAPRLWLGRTVWIRAQDIYPGGGVAWLIDPGGKPPSQGLPIIPGRWQTPTFPRSLIWWLSSNVPGLQGIDGGRVEVYRITLAKPLRAACSSCAVGYGQ
jgi:hypothetical protein